MAISIIGTILVGAVLGRFYKVSILFPAFALILVAVLGRAFYFHQGLLRPALEFALLVTSLQIGYVVIPISFVVMAPLWRIIFTKAFCGPLNSPCGREFANRLPRYSDLLCCYGTVAANNNAPNEQLLRHARVNCCDAATISARAVLKQYLLVPYLQPGLVASAVQ